MIATTFRQGLVVVGAADPARVVLHCQPASVDVAPCPADIARRRAAAEQAAAMIRHSRAALDAYRKTGDAR